MNIDKHFIMTMHNFKDRKEKCINDKEKMKEIVREENKYLLQNFHYLEEYYTNIDLISKNQNEKIKINEINSENKYWQHNGVRLTYYKSNICNNCNSEMVEDEAFLTCKKCSTFHPILLSSTTDEVHLPSNVSYSRLSHFKKTIYQFCGIKTMNIKMFDIESIKNRIKYDRVSKINYNSINTILKKLKLKKYIDQIYHILYILGHVNQVPKIDDNIVNKLIFLFNAIQEPFNRLKINSNFFNYKFTLYKLLVYLDFQEINPFIPRIKNIENLKLQNELFDRCLLQI